MPGILAESTTSSRLDTSPSIPEAKPYILFASNDLLVQFNTGGIQSCAAAGIVLILQEGEIFTLLVSNIGDKPHKVASFAPSVGLMGKIYLAKQTWVMDLAPVGVNVGVPLQVSISLTFKSQGSLWAFAYYMGGVHDEGLPRHVDVSGEETICRLPFTECHELWASAADMNYDFPVGKVFRSAD